MERGWWAYRKYHLNVEHNWEFRDYFNLYCDFQSNWLDSIHMFALWVDKSKRRGIIHSCWITFVTNHLMWFLFQFYYTMILFCDAVTIRMHTHAPIHIQMEIQLIRRLAMTKKNNMHAQRALS